MRAYAPDASIGAAARWDVVEHIRQVGELVQYNVRGEAHQRVAQCVGVKHVADDGLGTEVAKPGGLARGASQARDYVTGFHQERHDADADHAAGPGDENAQWLCRQPVSHGPEPARPTLD